MKSRKLPTSDKPVTAVLAAEDYHASIDTAASLPPAEPTAIFATGDTVEAVTAEAFDRLTEKQREVLGCIAIGQDGGHSRKTLESLLQRGMIVSSTETKKDRLGSFSIARYAMPLHIHVVWCAWCELHWKDGLTPEEIAEIEGMDT